MFSKDVNFGNLYILNRNNFDTLSPPLIMTKSSDKSYTSIYQLAITFTTKYYTGIKVPTYKKAYRTSVFKWQHSLLTLYFISFNQTYFENYSIVYTYCLNLRGVTKENVNVQSTWKNVYHPKELFGLFFFQ